MQAQRQPRLPSWAAGLLIGVFFSCGCCLSFVLLGFKDPPVVVPPEIMRAKAKQAGLPLDDADLGPLPTPNGAALLSQARSLYDTAEKSLTGSERDALRNATAGTVQDPEQLSRVLGKFGPCLDKIHGLGLDTRIEEALAPEPKPWETELDALCGIYKAKAALSASLGKPEEAIPAIAELTRLAYLLSKSRRQGALASVPREASGEIAFTLIRTPLGVAGLTSLEAAMEKPEMGSPSLLKPWVVRTRLSYAEYGKCVTPKGLNARRLAYYQALCRTKNPTAAQVFDLFESRMLDATLKLPANLDASDYEAFEIACLQPIRSINNAKDLLSIAYDNCYDPAEDWRRLIEEMNRLRKASAYWRMARTAILLKLQAAKGQTMDMAALPSSLTLDPFDPTNQFQLTKDERGLTLQSIGRIDSTHKQWSVPPIVESF